MDNIIFIIGGFFILTLFIFVAGMFLFPELFGISKNRDTDSSDTSEKK